MTTQKLDEVVLKADLAACAKAFSRVAEARRRELAVRALAWVEAIWARQYALEEGEMRWRPEQVLPAALRNKARSAVAQDGPVPLSNKLTKKAADTLLDVGWVAVFATVSLGELKQLGWPFHVKDDVAYRIMADRRPDWRHDWALWACQDRRRQWHLIRRLVRDGICDRPPHENYTLQMIEALSHRGSWVTGKASDPLANLLADPELLNDEVWRIFEIEGGGELSLAAVDKYNKLGSTWTTALVELSKRGRLSRDRLLDASLDALQRGFAQFRAGWFSRFHETMEPTIDERTQRVGRYLELLASRIPPTVSFALKALRVLEKAKRLRPAVMIEHVGPALSARATGTVAAALDMLAGAAQTDPSLSGSAAIAAGDALLHESAEVQSKAMDVIETLAPAADGQLREILHERRATIAASQRKRLDALLKGPTPPSHKPPSVEPVPDDSDDLLQQAAALDRRWAKLAGVPAALLVLKDPSKPITALVFDVMDVPRRVTQAPIAPITDLDALIDAFAAVLESQESPDEIERVLDGLNRLCDQRPPDFDQRVGPLRKRATTLLKHAYWPPFTAGAIRNDLCDLVIAWTTGALPSREPPQVAPDAEPSVGAFLSHRVARIAARAMARKAGPLLSAPTHSGGWIDPVVLVARCKQCQASDHETDLHDQVQALLRLTPDGRDEGAKAMRGIKGEFADALRYALGRSAEIGPTAPLWVAAARARDPEADDTELEAQHPRLGPDTGRAARYTPKLPYPQDEWPPLKIDRDPATPKKPDPLLPTCLMHRPLCTELRWAATVWPLCRESYCALGAESFAGNRDWWEAEWWQVQFLEPLLDPDMPLGDMARLLLVMGLTMKEPGQRGLATDALIAAIDDGRLDEIALGCTLGWLLARQFLVLPRVAGALRIAATSPLHALTIARAVQRALRDVPANPPRDIHALLELLRELLCETGQVVTVDGARTHLRKHQGAGKLGKLANELLALQPSPNSCHKSAAQRLLIGRIARARRWTSAT